MITQITDGVVNDHSIVPITFEVLTESIPCQTSIPLSGGTSALVRIRYGG